MNYLKLVKGYWKMHRQFPFTGNETLSYITMINLFSDEGEYDEWPEEMRYQDGLLAATIGVSINTMKTCRILLQQRGLITFTETGRGSRGGAVYSLVEHYNPAKRSSKSDELPPERSSKIDEPKRERSSKTSSKIDELPPERSSDFDELSTKDHQQVHQNVDQNLMNSIYIESKPSNPQTISLSQKKGEKQNFDSSQKPPVPLAPTNPRSAPPLSSPTEEEEIAADNAKREAFIRKLQTNRHLQFPLSSVQKITEQADRDEWIAAFVNTKWADPELTTKRQHDVIGWCQSWIKQEREKPQHNGQRKNTNGSTQYRASGRAAKQTAYLPSDALDDFGED